MDEVSVFLVGAGPGDPGLITRRGLELVRSCEVLLHDRLVSEELVDEAPAGAERLFVGKVPGETQMPQAAIDALIVDRARAGKRVVRLKGGDPFVFGRGADEGQALAAAGISFEVVPGVSAAVAVPGYAGIPVTHGGVASSFAVLTGHETGARVDAQERLAAVARGADTLVFLMGAASFADIADRLIAAGRPPEEPVAFVERGTTATQRTVVGKLATAAEVIAAERVSPPVTIVVGGVVGLRGALNWFESRPLFGRRVLVTRPAHQSQPLVRALRDAGADALELPAIEIAEPPSFEDLDAAIDRLAVGDYAWVFFASANAVDRFFARLEGRYDARAFGGTRVAAVGPSTERRLRARGIVADLVPETFTGTAAAGALGAGNGVILMPRPADAPDDAVAELESLGWVVDRPVVYETVQLMPAAIRTEAYDAVTFASPSAVAGFVRAFGVVERQLGFKVICIGPSTAKKAVELGLEVDEVADPHTTAGLVQAVVRALASPPRGTMGS